MKARKRPKLPPVSEQMKAWSAALTAEIAGWPRVSARSFFGFNALYRGEQMFAALPRTRAMHTPNSLVFKLVHAAAPLQMRLQADTRVGSMEMKKARWYTFELDSDADLHDALDWIKRSYDAAKTANPQKKAR
jgi:hypothetical protein